MIYWWVYYCFLKWNIVNRRLGSLPLSENGVLPIHVPEHSHSHLLNGDADQNKGTSRLKRRLAIEEGMAGISYPVIHRCPHKVLRSPILPALYQPWTTVAKELTQPGEVPQHVKVVGFERLPSELIQYVYRIDWYRHSVCYLLHLEKRIRAFTTGVPGQLLTALHWWILVPQNCYLWTLQVESSCRDISKT